MALLVVADQYNLNPFTKEIYAFPDKQNGIVPIVGIDGWSRIINENHQFDGMEFTQSANMMDMPNAKPAPEWIECIIYRKDRDHPIKVREYLDEVYRPPFKAGMSGPWQTHTKRMLRHKTMIQAARIAFGYTGVYDPDEGERIIEGQVIEHRAPQTAASNIESALNAKPADEVAGVSYAAIAEMLNKAETKDQIDEAVSLSSDLPDEQKQELQDLAEQRAMELA